MNKRYPRYPDDADYQTNSPSYYEDLARKNKLIKMLAEKIWEYDERLDERLEDLENVLQDYLSQWDDRIENLDDEVSYIFIEWLEDGTLEQIINHDVLGNKADKDYVDNLNESLTTLLTQIVINVNDYGAIGDGISDDTLAIKNAIDSISNDTINLYFPSDEYLITDSLGIIDKKINIIGNNTRLKVSNDIPFVFDFLEEVTIKDITIDHMENTLLEKFSVRLNNVSKLYNVHFKNVIGMGTLSNTNNQYFIEINTNAENVELEKCSFADIYNYGDGERELYGFCGFVFVFGQGLIDRTLNVSVKECSFRGTETLYFGENDPDPDADGFRMYITDPVAHDRRNVKISFENNEFRNCQKRFYKINDALVSIKGDICYSDYEMSHLAQFRNCIVTILGGKYEASFADGFVALDNTDIHLNGVEIKNTKRNANSRVIGIQTEQTGSHTIKNVVATGLDRVIYLGSVNPQTNILIADSRFYDFRSFIHVTREFNSLYVKDIYIELGTIEDVPDERGVYIGQNINQIILENITFKELITRSSYGETRGLIVSNVPIQLNNIKVIGDDVTLTSRLYLNGDNSKVTNSQIPSLDGTGSDIIFSNSIYIRILLDETVIDHNNLKVDSW